MIRQHRPYAHAAAYAPTGRIFTRGPWQLAYKAAALCPDGRWRMVEITGEPDTYYTLPARAHIAGRWQRGYLIYDRTAAGDPILTFRANAF